MYLILGEFVLKGCLIFLDRMSLFIGSTVGGFAGCFTCLDMMSSLIASCVGGLDYSNKNGMIFIAL